MLKEPGQLLNALKRAADGVMKICLAGAIFARFMPDQKFNKEKARSAS